MPDYPTLIPKTTTPTPETLPGGGIQLPALFSPDSATAQFSRPLRNFFHASQRHAENLCTNAAPLRSTTPPPSGLELRRAAVVYIGDAC